MLKKVRLIGMITAVLVSGSGVAQADFSDEFAPSKWTYTETDTSQYGPTNSLTAPTMTISSANYSTWVTTAGSTVVTTLASPAVQNQAGVYSIAVPHGTGLVSFDYSYYLEVCPHPNKWMGYTMGRIQTLTRLLQDGIINKDKPHHLLGCSLPIEFMFYRTGFDWIETIDTSSPIVHGLLDIVYEPGGLVNKQSIKLIELLGSNPTTTQMRRIKHNVMRFRTFCQGVPYSEIGHTDIKYDFGLWTTDTDKRTVDYTTA